MFVDCLVGVKSQASPSRSQGNVSTETCREASKVSNLPECSQCGHLCGLASCCSWGSAHPHASSCISKSLCNPCVFFCMCLLVTAFLNIYEQLSLPTFTFLITTTIMRTSIRSSWLARASLASSSQTLSPGFVPFRSFRSPRISPLSTTPLLRRLPRHQPWQSTTFIRHNTDLAASHTSPTPKTPDSSSPTVYHPAYELYFTCKPCSLRSGPHRVTKQGFHHGSTLITCPSCSNKHVISDHLKIFTDEGGDLIDIMKRHGGKLKKGKLGIGNEGDEEIEFWEDETETPHVRPNAGSS